MAPRLRPLALLPALLVAPAVGHATAAPRTSSVKVAACDPAAKTATFEAAIRRVPDATRLQVRFTLQARSASQPAWASVPAAGFDAWLSAKRGRAAFVYDKTVRALAPGEYRVVVRYRWRDDAGDTVARAKRVSHSCEQPDPRPDLVPEAVSVTRTASGARYVLTVANAGATRSSATTATLRTGAVTLRPLAVGPIDAGDMTTVTADGPACSPRAPVVATVDPRNAVDEADEAGNVLTVPCPS